MNPKRIGLALVLIGFGSCVAPIGNWSDSGSPSSPYGIPSVARPAEDQTSVGSVQSESEVTKLYARDGGVVDSQEPGSVVEAAPGHDVNPTNTGRMYILELYQEAIDERDALQLEVTALSAALERAQLEMDDFSRRMARADSKLATVTTERDRLRIEIAELAARTVTAQIGRLESDKLLLEAKLSWFREAEREAKGLSSTIQATSNSVVGEFASGPPAAVVGEFTTSPPGLPSGPTTFEDPKY